MFGKEAAKVTTDLLYVPVPGGVLIAAILIAARFRGKGDHGKAYLFFVGFVASWFIAETIWAISEVFYNLSPFPSEAEWFYLAGYPLLILFSVYYLKPLEKALSGRILSYGFLASVTFLIPTIYTTYSYNSNAGLAQIIWASIYPLLDAIVLFPAVLGLTLYFKGQVSFLWSLTCIAIILNIIADSGFLFLHVDKSYYTGNPIDILYLWAYILFAFGIYSHVKLYKKPKMKSYGDVEGLK
jgi:hypothetical protein